MSFKIKFRKTATYEAFIWKALERLENNEENFLMKRLFYLVHFI